MNPSSPWCPKENPFQEYLVREENIWLIGDDVLAFLVRFLPGIAGKGDWPFLVWIAHAQELLQFLHLAIRQCVHRIDNDSLHTSPGSIAQHIIDDGDDIGQAFPRTGPGSQHVA